MGGVAQLCQEILGRRARVEDIPIKWQMDRLSNCFSLFGLSRDLGLLARNLQNAQRNSNPAADAEAAAAAASTPEVGGRIHALSMRAQDPPLSLDSSVAL